MSRTRNNPLADDLVRPLFHTTVWFYGVALVLGTIVLCGAAAWAYQIWYGIGVAGINWPVYWGFYLTNFVFWIGISHAGTLISAILRLVNARWRRPVTRCAEVITVFALMIGAMFPIIHLGKPWLFFWLAPYPSARDIWPNFRSPLVWDFFAINTYLTGSLLFLLLPMIPDFALVRDRSTGLRKRIYGALALGWQGTTKQWHRLEAAMQIMAVAIIPVAVSVHTIVSFDFSMAHVPMWHSTIFGPYFVAGAIFSGIAALIIAMAVLRKMLQARALPAPGALREPGQAAAADEPAVGLLRVQRTPHRLVRQLAVGDGGVLGHPARRLRAALLDDGGLQLRAAARPSCRSSGCGRSPARSSRRSACSSACGSSASSSSCPALAHKELPYSWGSYSPRPTELVIMAATFAAMALLYMLFSKFVPIISIWEMKVGNQPHPAAADTPAHEDELAALWRARP